MRVTLVESCTSDLNVVNAARVSLNEQSSWEVETRIVESDPTGLSEPITGVDLSLSDRDAGLIGFLMRNRHGTPFEHGYMRFHVEAPIFVFREWHRHRVGHSYNEMSGRYVKMEKRFYVPDSWRVQTGKPGAYTYEDVAEGFDADEADVIMDDAYEQSWGAYETLLDMGVAKEQARAVLPVGLYTQMHWTCNPRSLMHFLGLRNKPDAMKEIRDLAAQAEEEFLRLMPVTASEFIEQGRVAP